LTNASKTGNQTLNNSNYFLHSVVPSFFFFHYYKYISSHAIDRTELWPTSSLSKSFSAT